jgi:hypothetical protein
MINSYEDLHTVTQNLYCIAYRGTCDGKERICYLQESNKPLFFYNYEQAKEYFNLHKIATVRDRTFWLKGKLIYSDAKIIKVTLSNFILENITIN